MPQHFCFFCTDNESGTGRRVIELQGLDTHACWAQVGCRIITCGLRRRSGCGVCRGDTALAQRGPDFALQSTVREARIAACQGVFRIRTIFFVLYEYLLWQQEGSEATRPVRDAHSDIRAPRHQLPGYHKHQLSDLRRRPLTLLPRFSACPSC